MPEWVWFLVILPAATWRISNIITQEKIFEKVRQLVGITIDEETLLEIIPDTYVAYLFNCLRCMSIWIALVCLGIYYIYPEILLLFAISASAIGIDEVFNGTR